MSGSGRGKKMDLGRGGQDVVELLLHVSTLDVGILLDFRDSLCVVGNHHVLLVVML